MLAPLREIETLEREKRDQGLGGIGHNNPPTSLEDIGLGDGMLSELSEAVRSISSRVTSLELASQSFTTKQKETPDWSEALRENTAAIEENNRVVRAGADALQSTVQKIGLSGRALYAADKIFGEILTRIGSELADVVVPLVKNGSVSLPEYLQLAADLLTKYSRKVALFLNFFS